MIPLEANLAANELIAKIFARRTVDECDKAIVADATNAPQSGITNVCSKNIHVKVGEGGKQTDSTQFTCEWLYYEEAAVTLS